MGGTFGKGMKMGKREIYSYHKLGFKIQQKSRVFTFVKCTNYLRFEPKEISNSGFYRFSMQSNLSRRFVPQFFFSFLSLLFIIPPLHNFTKKKNQWTQIEWIPKS